MKDHQQAQDAVILQHLQSGNTITDLEAWRLCKCRRLSARICGLRKQGHIIESKPVRTATGKRIAQYSLNTQTVAPC